jgi:hypothetical protein
LVDRFVGTILVNVRVVGASRQRHHGSTDREREDERHCCDEGLHDWSPLAARMAFDNVTLAALAEIEREAIHFFCILFSAV